jgi:DNA-binding MarR family transcriptional regulator
MMEQTALDLRNLSYHSLNLGEKQEQVYNAIEQYQPVTNRQLSNILRWPINSITGRVKELRDMGLVHKEGSAYDQVTERTVSTWRTK